MNISFLERFWQQAGGGGREGFRDEKQQGFENFRAAISSFYYFLLSFFACFVFPHLPLTVFHNLIGFSNEHRGA